MPLFHPIHHTFAPHVDTGFLMQSLGMLLQPWKWRNGSAVKDLTEALSKQYDGEAHLFASGRQALLAALKSLNLQSGDEVIIQGYTCTAVPNAITAAGGTPIYADIDPDTLNLTPETVEAKITNATRAVICQHTFGIPARAGELKELCDQYDIPLIEDCAHAMPDRSDPHRIAAHGDMLIFSFGRDKAISGITGGALIIRNQHLYNLQPTTYNLSMSIIFKLLLYPLIYSIAKPLYGLTIGKAFLAGACKASLLVAITTKEEKRGSMDTTLHTMPNAFAHLALTQLRKVQSINDHRRKLTALYLQQAKEHGWKYCQAITEDLPLQKFPLVTSQAEDLRRTLRKQNIHLDDGWTNCIVCPKGVDLTAAKYPSGTTPQAEALCSQILSLPTHPTMTLKQAKHLVQSLNTALHDHH